MVEPNTHRHTRIQTYLYSHSPKDKHPFSEILWFESRKEYKKYFLNGLTMCRLLPLGQCFILAVRSESVSSFSLSVSPEWIFQACLNMKELKTRGSFFTLSATKRWGQNFDMILCGTGQTEIMAPGLPFSSLPDPGEREEGGKELF